MWPFQVGGRNTGKGIVKLIHLAKYSKSEEAAKGNLSGDWSALLTDRYYDSTVRGEGNVSAFLLDQELHVLGRLTSASLISHNHLTALEKMSL